MNSDRILLDTVFVQALLNQHDQYYQQAVALLPRIRTAMEVWITEAVIVEVGNALSIHNRAGAVQFIRQCYHTPNMRVVAIDSGLLERAVNLYDSRVDKEWGLTDCISFTVMQDQNLLDAATADRHFVQAGFHALLQSD
jgi:predicted nucleic acid-binding protein